MSRKWNIINNVVSLVATMCLVVLAATVRKDSYSGDMAGYIALYLAGAVVWGFVNTVVHEAGHIISGKANGFAFYSVTVWFFHLKKENGKLSFGFNMIGGEAGYTEMIPTKKENVGKSYKKMTLGGINASLIASVLSIFPIIFCKYISVNLYAFLAMSFPVSVYFFLNSVLPMESEGVKNDGAVALSFHRKEDTALVQESVLKAQAELYVGVLPKDLDKELLFDLPQLPEDDLNFIALLDLRYAYYLDGGNFEEAVKVNERLCDIAQYIPKPYKFPILAESLYVSCAIKKDEEKAEETLYELDKYINNANTAQNIRVKLAYLMEIRGETTELEMFFDKFERECAKLPLKGNAEYERRLVAPLKEKAVFIDKTPDNALPSE